MADLRENFISIFEDLGLLQYLHYIAKMKRYTGSVEKYKCILTENRVAKNI